MIDVMVDDFIIDDKKWEYNNKELIFHMMI